MPIETLVPLVFGLLFFVLFLGIWHMSRFVCFTFRCLVSLCFVLLRFVLFVFVCVCVCECACE